MRRLFLAVWGTPRVEPVLDNLRDLPSGDLSSPVLSGPDVLTSLEPVPDRLAGVGTGQGHDRGNPECRQLVGMIGIVGRGCGC
ncbi:MAG: hypothetical protein WB611_02935 [Stellaceae bacterium]